MGWSDISFILPQFKYNRRADSVAQSTPEISLVESLPITCTSLAVLPALCLLISFIYSTVRATRITLTYDEAYTFLYFAQLPFTEILTDYHFPNNHILHSLFMRSCYLLFGVSNLALRLPALFGAALFMGSLWLIAKRLPKPISAIWIISVAFIPAIVDYNTMARGYSLGSGFSYLALFFLLEELHEPSKSLWRIVLAALCMALSLASVPTMVFFNVALCISFLVVILSIDVRKSIIAAVCLLVVTGGVTTLFYFQIDTNPSSFPWGHQNYADFWHQYWIDALYLPTSLSGGWTTFLNYTLGVCVLLGVFRAWRTNSRPLLLMVLTLLFATILLFLSKPVLGTIYPFPRGFFTTLPLVVLTLLIVIFELLKVRPYLALSVGALMPTVLLCRFLFMTQPMLFTFYQGRDEGIPEALERIREMSPNKKRPRLAVHQPLSFTLRYEVARNSDLRIRLVERHKADFWLTTKGAEGDLTGYSPITLELNTKLRLYARSAIPSFLR